MVARDPLGPRAYGVIPATRSQGLIDRVHRDIFGYPIRFSNVFSRRYLGRVIAPLPSPLSKGRSGTERRSLEFFGLVGFEIQREEEREREREGLTILAVENRAAVFRYTGNYY